jgi:tetratricopeptide (TPR) repeat protein
VRTELSDVAPGFSNKGDNLASANTGTYASTIALQRWEPKAGYLDRLRRAGSKEHYAIYLEERTGHLRQPGFYLDVAGFFLEAKETEFGLRILSNLAELELEDAALLRVLAHRLVEAGRPELARPLFERVLTLRPEEPQSRRDLALTCAAVKQYQRAVDLLWEVVDRAWSGRFPGIELIALGELNAIVATCGEKLDLTKVDARLRRNLPVGLRVILTWDADNCDIDLWVDDPNGEKTYYGAPLSGQGGRMSQDFTQGYGPEEFLLREPKAGKYQVRINYFGDRRQNALGPVTAQVRLITGFGTPAEKEQRLTVRLEDNKETLEIGSIEIGGR